MAIPDSPTIVIAERLSDGLVIKFDNAKCGFCSSAFLYSKFSECEELNEAHKEW